MFRGYDTTRERLVAVKLFRIDIAPERAHQLVAELERLIAANLSHPALAKPIATGITGVSAYLASDYVAADSFDLTIRELGRPSAADALQVAGRLAGALDQAAEAGITHGCLHPRDVLMSSKETRLTGIGVGEALAEIGVPAPVRRPYSAPERLEDARWDRRADIFSLAALVHEMLWGRRIAGIGAQAVEGLSEVAGGNLDALKAAFGRALAEDPADRHPTAAAFVNALKRALPEVVTPTSAGAEPERTARGSRAVVAHVRPHEDAESLLPLEPPRFTEVDVESDVAAVRSGPSIIEADDDADAPRRVAPVEEPHEPEPLVLSWMSPPPDAPKPPVPDVAAEKTADKKAERKVDAPAAAAPQSSTASVSESAKPSPPEPPNELAPEPPKRAPVRAEPAAPSRAEPAVQSTAQPSLVARENESPSREAPAIRLSLGGNVETAPPDSNMLERSRSALWPLVLALGVGATLGFAGGYAVGVRDRPAPPVSTTAAAVPQTPGREFTEAAVPAPPKPAAADEVRPKTDAADAKTAEAKTAEAKTAVPRTEVSTPAAGNAVRRGPPPVQAPPARGAAPKVDLKGRLNIRSTPAGARIFVDDREAGRTPAAVRDLAEGPHVVRIVRDGYAAADRRIVLTRERPAQAMTFTLERLPVPAARGAQPPRAVQQPTRAVQAPPPAPAGQGSLVVESRPAGARVFVNGRPLGTTPFSTGGLPAGDHTIRLELDGYRAWLASVRIVANEQARVSASLER